MQLLIAYLVTPDFITFLRHHIAKNDNQRVTSNNWVTSGDTSYIFVSLHHILYARF